MTVEELFSNLLAHMVKGLMIHNKLASGYSFLNLCGYEKCHIYHFFEESYSCIALQHFYISTYHKLIPEKEVENPDVIPVNWYKYTKLDVDTNTKRAAIRELMKAWVDWEKETNKLLEQYYKELYEMGEINAALKIGDILQDNSKELQRAYEEYINLESIGYDISIIVEKQKPLFDIYLNKIKCIYEEDE